MPSARHEDWKYTDLRPIVEISNRWLAEPAPRADAPALDTAVAEISKAAEADWLIIVNGRVDADTLAVLSGAGITVSLLSNSDVVLESALPLTQLNTALLQDGLRIQIDANAELRSPIGLLLLDDSTSSAGVSHARINIEVAANARASIVEYHVSLGDAPHYANSVIDLALAPGAATDYVRVQHRGRAHSQTARLDVHLDRDSRFRHCGFDLGGARRQLDAGEPLPGESAAPTARLPAWPAATG